MVSEAEIESIISTLVIQGYIKREDGRVEITEEGRETFIALAGLVDLPTMSSVTSMAMQFQIAQGER